MLFGGRAARSGQVAARDARMDRSRDAGATRSGRPTWCQLRNERRPCLRKFSSASCATSPLRAWPSASLPA